MSKALIDKKVTETKGGKFVIIGLTFIFYFYTTAGVVAVFFPYASAFLANLAQTAIGSVAAIVATVITGHSAVEFKQSGTAAFSETAAQTETKTIEERDLGRGKEKDYTHEV